ncbi:MFS transporter [Thermogymnomonas acidicola]|uniref:MFS transporter n=1 Tax=Thermogymnomonas acidicola TaxID=399579 RepID=UPI0014947F7C|nr:MFS transporter [Thermogymnomonas acidicola]
MESTRKMAVASRLSIIAIFIVGAIPALVSDFDGSAYTYASTYIISAVHLPAYYYGVLISGYAAGIAVFSLVGGFLFDRVSPPKTVVVASVLFFSVFTILTGYSTSAAELVASRVLVGVRRWDVPVCIRIVPRGGREPGGEGGHRCHGVGGVLAGVGTFLAPPYVILPFLPDYRIPFLISGILGFVVAGIFQTVIPRVFKNEPRARNPLKDMVNRYSIFPPMLAMFFFGFTLLNILGYYSDLLEKVIGFSDAQAAVIISLLGVGGVVFGIPAGYLSDRIGRKGVLVIGITLIALGALGITYSPRNMGLFIFLTLAFGTGWSIFSILSPPAAGQDMVRDEVVGSVSGGHTDDVQHRRNNRPPLLLAYEVARNVPPLKTGMLYLMDIPALVALVITVAMRYPKNIREVVRQQLLEDTSIRQ